MSTLVSSVFLPGFGSKAASTTAPGAQSGEFNSFRAVPYCRRVTLFCASEAKFPGS